MPMDSPSLRKLVWYWSFMNVVSLVPLALWEIGALILRWQGVITGCDPVVWMMCFGNVSMAITILAEFRKQKHDRTL